jgi:hypothetical protein
LIKIILRLYQATGDLDLNQKPWQTTKSCLPFQQCLLVLMVVKILSKKIRADKPLSTLIYRLEDGGMLAFEHLNREKAEVSSSYWTS